MRLKSLDIKGFKSFANPIHVKFDEGVTGIVGPNGSGKSNIVDSIRWVLGEQKSKELRLESMVDVIFNGTKTRKKGGAAQVTLTFENTKNVLPTEYKEVAISRTLYRSGESEYKLNGVKCRLKDIRNLFIDSGIGSNTYAIIELGMVDSILSDKENSRRKMFEQAAGISKYKIRKREALSKLALTKADLDRVEDLLFELENSMKSLEKQAKRTERYYKIKEEYKGLKITVTKSQIKEYDRELFGMQTLQNERMAHLTEVKASIAKAEVALEELKTKNLNDEIKLNETQKQLNAIVSDIQSVEGTESLRKQELTFLRTSETELHKRILDNKNQSIDLEGAIQEKKELEAAEQEQLKTVSDQLFKVREAYESFRLEVTHKSESSNENEQLSLKYQNEIFEYEKQLVKAEGNLQRTKERLQELNASESFNTQQVEELNAVIEESTQLIAKLENDHKIAEEKYTKAITDANNVEESRKETADAKNQIARDLDRVTTESNMLKNMVDSLEGFPESVKFVHDVTKGKIPLLSDLFFCPKPYRNAVESYLENYLNYFVAQTEEEALKAIDLLKQGQKGRASFFLLNRLSSQSEIVKEDSIVGKLQFDKKYTDLFAHLFGGIKLAQKGGGKNSEYILEDSTVIQRKYTVSGGSVGLFTGKKVGRKKAYEESLKSVEKLTKDLQKVTEKLEVIDNKITNTDNEELRKAKAQIDVTYMNEKYKHEQVKKNYVKAITNKQENADTKITYLNTLTETEREIAEVSVLLAEKKEAKIKVDRILADEKSTLTGLQEELSQQSASVNTQNIEKIKKENSLNSITEARERLAQRKVEVEQDLEKDQKSLEEVKANLEELKTSGTDMTEEIKALYDQKTELTSAVNTIEQLYFQEKSHIQDQEKGLRDLHGEHNTLQSKINSSKEREQTYLYEKKGLVDRLQIEFNIQESEIFAEQEQEEDVSQNLNDVKLRLEKLEKRIENYGDINPLAITAYEEIKERNDYIVSQRDDILEATEDLHKTIAEIEEEANAKFKTAFDQIKVHFQEVFRTFFTEDDKCDLILEDESNPLDSPIEIIAQPKGKRPKSLSQLSGGEKTLTATALLFALYLLKPAPFCIFDEVDAPLDDLNVQKFTKLISQFSKNSQFVIITHNKVTMAAVDMLYGVFMQEIGVSEISAVDFTDKGFDFNYQGIEN